MADPIPSWPLHRAHGSWHGEIVHGDDVELLICDTCHHIEALCLHRKNSWSEDGTTLTCNFCGLDVT